jgi:hypothetical protein
MPTERIFDLLSLREKARLAILAAGGSEEDVEKILGSARRLEPKEPAEFPEKLHAYAWDLPLEATRTLRHVRILAVRGDRPKLTIALGSKNLRLATEADLNVALVREIDEGDGSPVGLVSNDHLLALVREQELWLFRNPKAAMKHLRRAAGDHVEITIDDADAVASVKGVVSSP